MASFRCYDNSDVIATLIMTNFHLYLMQLWWQFFQMFVRYCPWKTVSRHFHMPVRPILLHHMGLVSFLLCCKNVGNLQEFFLANGLPLPLAENCSYAYARIFLWAVISKACINRSTKWSLKIKISQKNAHIRLPEYHLADRFIEFCTRQLHNYIYSPRKMWKRMRYCLNYSSTRFLSTEN